MATLLCENSASSGPICMKQKTVSKLTKILKVHNIFVKVAPLVHQEKWRHLSAFITIGHQAPSQLDQSR